MLIRLLLAAVLCSLSERFATSETAQAALCCRPLQKAIELYNLSDAAAYGELCFLVHAVAMHQRLFLILCYVNS